MNSRKTDSRLPIQFSSLRFHVAITKPYPQTSICRSRWICAEIEWLSILAWELRFLKKRTLQSQSNLSCQLAWAPKCHLKSHCLTNSPLPLLCMQVKLTSIWGCEHWLENHHEQIIILFRFPAEFYSENFRFINHDNILYNTCILLDKESYFLQKITINFSTSFYQRPGARWTDRVCLLSNWR